MFEEMPRFVTNIKCSMNVVDDPDFHYFAIFFFSAFHTAHSIA